MTEAGDTRVPRSCWVGVDPGGRDAFGVAFVPNEGEPSVHCVSCADEAIELIQAEPLGVGIDAPLWWSSGLSSERQADRWIRRTYRISPGTVQTANSLRGAALVQGAMFIQRLRELFPLAKVTEAHPKALALAHGGWSCGLFDGEPFLHARNDHERDAILAAVAAREGFTGRWSLDLASGRGPSEQDPSSYWLAPVRYFWPAPGELVTRRTS